MDCIAILLKRAHIHADSALGGFFDFTMNPLGFSTRVTDALLPIQHKMLNLGLADSLCFDFQKLGQTPYLTSLYLVKDAADLQLLELQPEETPYVGHRGYGEYHTGYTLECSRMASSISIYSALLAFGVEGYQRLLAQFVEVNHSFREELVREIPGLEIVNPDNPGIITLFRIYRENSLGHKGEISGQCSLDEINESNKLNEVLFEILGEHRDQIFFGDTKKHIIVQSSDGFSIPLYASKIFVISPYTEVKHVQEIVMYLKDKVFHAFSSSNELTTNRG